MQHTATYATSRSCIQRSAVRQGIQTFVGTTLDWLLTLPATRNMLPATVHDALPDACPVVDDGSPAAPGAPTFVRQDYNPTYNRIATQRIFDQRPSTRAVYSLGLGCSEQVTVFGSRGPRRFSYPEVPTAR